MRAPSPTKEAASRCGCGIEDLCPGPLAGIDEGDKIRTIYDGSVGGANDTIRNQTVERTTAPTVLDGVQALHWLHAAAAEGPPSQGAPRGRSSNLRLGLAMAGAGHQVGAAQGGCHQGPPESESPQEGLTVPGGFTGGWVNKVGTYGMARPNPTGDAWQPFYSGSSTHSSLKWIGTSSLWMTSCGCFEARGQ